MNIDAVSVGSRVVIGAPELTIIAGPCLAESTQMCLEVARAMSTLCAELGFQYVFKASFDKANRTSSGSIRGEGIESGLEKLAEVGAEVGVPITTDVHSPEQAARAAEVVDLLQIPAFLCRQTDLLEAAAATAKPVNVKKGQFLAPEDTKNIVAKLRKAGANGVVLTERGATFGYHTLVVDMPGLETMRGFGVPVCFDATHSAQRPGGAGDASGGVRDSIPAMVRAAVAVGVDALFLEVHPDPAAAASDKETQWPLARARELLLQVQRLHAEWLKIVARDGPRGA